GPRTATGGGEKTASWQAAKAPTKRRAVSLRIGARLCTLHGHRARPALLTIRGITSEKTPARRMHRRRHRSARDAFRSTAIVLRRARQESAGSGWDCLEGDGVCGPGRGAARRPECPRGRYHQRAAQYGLTIRAARHL